MQESELQEQEVQEVVQTDPQLEELTEETSEFSDIAIYLYDVPDLAGVYAGIFGACLIAYMLFTLILRSIGGDD